MTPMPPARRKSGTWITIAFLMLLAVTWIVYWPGLHGPFLFDDYANLPALGNFGGVRDWESFKQYALTGIAGPTGRPLALISFLLNDNGWPSTPYSFKYTNVLLHLLTSILLFVLLRQLLAAFQPERSRANEWIALSCAAFWLLHPLNVSTALYIVQRMAILSALFSILALVGYLHGRRLLATRPGTAYWRMSLALLFGTLASVLSKENGILTPILALALECTVLAASNQPRPHWLWRLTFLWGALAALLAYFVFLALSGSLLGGYATRSFTLTQRLLTEPSILLDYLGYWLIPRSRTRGLFAEDFPVASDWLDPWYTLPAILIVITTFIAAVRLRRRQPLFAAAVLFFFGGHLLESTVIPLELYFEHRNYLPAMLLVLPLADRASQLGPRPRMLALAIPLVIITILTGWLTLLWSNGASLALYWAETHPNSIRAQTVAEAELERIRRRDLALEVNTRALQRHPDNIELTLNRLLLRCRLDGLSEDDIGQAVQVLRRGDYQFRTFAQLRALVDSTIDPSCRGMDGDRVRALLAALTENPLAAAPSAKRQMLHLIGVLEVLEGRGQSGYSWFTDSQITRPDPDLGLLEVATLASYGWLDLALQHLDRIEALIRAGAKGPTGGLDYLLAAERLRQQINDAKSELPGRQP